VGSHSCVGVVAVGQGSHSARPGVQRYLGQGELLADRRSY
jgi:hypothetical protein